MSEPEKLFQDDPDFDDSIRVKFPNGKSVPLGSINKPHARIPGVTVPGKDQDPDEFYKEKNAKREEAQQRVREQRQAQEEAHKASNQQQGDQQPLANDDMPKGPDDVFIKFPNGKSVPLSKINKPHAPIHHPKTNGDNAGGLLHSGGHRPSN